MLLRSRRTKDGGIIREMSLSMREPSVSPRGADAECVPTRSGRRGFPFKGERRWGKHVRKGEIAIQSASPSRSCRGQAPAQSADITALSNVQFFCRSRIQVVDKIFVLVAVKVASTGGEQFILIHEFGEVFFVLLVVRGIIKLHAVKAELF